MKYTHVSVLLQEVIEMVDIVKNEWYVDATVGGGGYTKAILEKGGRVLGIDQDTDALEYVEESLRRSGIEKSRYQLIHANFSDIEDIVSRCGIEKIAGVVYDLGLSSYQIEQSGRGFSFLRSERLDMRMNKASELSAYDIVNTYSADELTFIFEKYGEEHEARAIAIEIVKNRKIKKIETTDELVEIIRKVVGNRGKIHPATKIFQALRIEVNDEIAHLKKGLEAGFSTLEKKGRMVVVTFHSLEDRVVKLYFQQLIAGGFANVLTAKPQEASDEEVRENRRARSARLRGIVKV